MLNEPLLAFFFKRYSCLNLQQEAAIDLYWFSAAGKSVYQLCSVNKGAVTRDRTITESHDMWEILRV